MCRNLGLASLGHLGAYSGVEQQWQCLSAPFSPTTTTFYLQPEQTKDSYFHFLVVFT